MPTPPPHADSHRSGEAEAERSSRAPEDSAALAATERALRELLELVPEDAFTHHKYAKFLVSGRRGDEAAAEFRRALELQPDFSEALRDFAALLASRREYGEAEALLRRAVAIRPDDVQALCDLGNVLVNLRCGREAIMILRCALRLSPNEYRLCSNLGLAFTETGLFPDAEAAFFEALRLKPMFVGAHNNLANLYIAMGRLKEARACLDLAENIERGNLITVCNRALVFLAMGDYQTGWRDYQRRWERPHTPHRKYAAPLWRGESLEGRRILLYTGEGLGDRIQFIRYAALLRDRGARVICECPMPLMEVFATVRGLDDLVEMGRELPPFDCHAPLLSLPHFLNTTLETVPAQVPYIAADPARAARWREYFHRTAGGGELLVGVVWQGNPHHQWDRFRSLPLMAFESLAAIPGVKLVSLQRGPGVEQIPPFQRFTGNRMIVPTDGAQSSPADLADSAAIMASLDLVISVDTAPAHLAGALARPVWTLLATVTDWRWMTARPDTPWYPTMRLFRQKRLNDWDELLARVAASLSDLAARSRHQAP